MEKRPILGLKSGRGALDNPTNLANRADFSLGPRACSSSFVVLGMVVLILGSSRLRGLNA